MLIVVLKDIEQEVYVDETEEGCYSEPISLRRGQLMLARDSGSMAEGITTFELIDGKMLSLEDGQWMEVEGEVRLC